MRNIRRSTAVLVAFVLFAAFASPALAQQSWSVQASVGPSFASVGTTVAAIGMAEMTLNDRFSLVGEAGVLPRAPFDRAEELALPLPNSFQASERRVNGMHANANLRWAIPGLARLEPYATAGLGTFVADTRGWRDEDGVRFEERRRATDFATNVGAGVQFPLTEHLGVNADYRTFFMHRPDDTPVVHRFTTGLAVRLF